MTYRIDGVEVGIPAGRVAAFWAAHPHQLIDDAPDDWVHWLTVPLSEFLGWNVADGLTTRLLRGEVLLLDDHTAISPIARLEQWGTDLATQDAWIRDTVHLELEAYLRRVAFEPVPQSSPQPVGTAAGGPSRLAGQMAAFIAAHSAEPISVSDVARAVHVHPGYAMTVFRQGIGTTIGTYLTQCRLAQAQRLLLTSDASVQDLAHAAGFSSTSQFYDRFRAAYQSTPAAYRRSSGRGSL